MARPVYQVFIKYLTSCSNNLTRSQRPAPLHLHRPRPCNNAQFNQVCTLRLRITSGFPFHSLLRIWNYNKSRIHSYRGARFVEVSLDDCFIFRGEIAKAPGILNGSEESAEGMLCRRWCRFRRWLFHHFFLIEHHDVYRNRCRHRTSQPSCSP